MIDSLASTGTGTFTTGDGGGCGDRQGSPMGAKRRDGTRAAGQRRRRAATGADRRPLLDRTDTGPGRAEEDVRQPHSRTAAVQQRRARQGGGGPGLQLGGCPVSDRSWKRGRSRKYFLAAVSRPRKQFQLRGLNHRIMIIAMARIERLE